MGAARDPDYWRRWRAAHPEYREREGQRRRDRRAKMTPEERRKDRGRPAPKPVEDDAPLPPLMPQLQHGVAVSFWEDELRLDLAQEAWLAALENRDPEDAVRAYRRRELGWRHHTCPFMLDGFDD